MRSALCLIVLVACGGRQDQVNREREDFICRDRIASYVATRHLGGDELGVQMDCAETGPRIKRWRVDKTGARLEDARSLTPGEFDRVWREIAGTGWPNLTDCGNVTAGKHDPIYTFDVKDDQNTATFACQSREMPYPYDGIVNPMDSAAQKGRNQLGDDEPDDLKALETKAPKP
ncbi:MAG: hypothetical protein WKG01_10670 [Kofleriaceae bacterium]